MPTATLGKWLDLRPLLLLLALLASSLFASPARAESSLHDRMKALPPGALEELFVFVAGNTLFTLHHEGGHMLVSELGLPILGQEEDAVDNLATVTMLSFGSEDMDLLLSNAMIGWFLAAETDHEDLIFYDEHDLDLQRGYRMLCLMVGSDPAAFADLAFDLDLPDERAETCSFDYEQAAISWEIATEAYLRSEFDTRRQIAVRHDDPGVEFEQLSVFLKESELMETVAEELDSLYKLADPVTFRAATCGEENAFWDPQSRELTLCYELVAGFAEVYFSALMSDG
ncbi:hypothetical protein DYI23_02980 [Roseibium polysiphoniae]|uniref:Metallopeptidase DUF4344 n=1 Tax=Roseibium polysiphoniae TaxID=2571221 RepID=A0A944CB64_9HYPH|nr:DUF4344 domain-containing metallopeptidase [Roseibium polysiphoniae]MBS8259174.1 hypothetical protein [Roseibium polysiphoniae]